MKKVIESNNVQALTYKPHSKKSTILTVASLFAIFTIVGATGGYFAFRLFGPKVMVVSKTGSLGYIPTKGEIDGSLRKNTLVTDFDGKHASLVNYALNQQAAHPYSLTITRGQSVTLGKSQNIQSYNLRTQTDCYFETRATGFKNIFGKFYDNTQDITGYITSSPEGWKTAEEKDFSYDDYIQAYGKLFRGNYYCSTSEEKITADHIISDKFLTIDSNEYTKSEDTTKHQVNDIVIYYITQKMIKSSTLNKTEDGYQLDLSLDTKADTYYVAQMVTTGGVGLPVFQSTDLTFYFDEDMEMKQGHFKDVYQVMGVACTQDLNLYFYHNDNALNFEGVDFKIPEKDETEDQSAKLIDSLS